LEDHALAVALWRKATTQALPDALVGEAYSQGYQLGLDEELRPLSETMLQLGRQGSWGLHPMTMEELLAWAAQQRQFGVQLDERYRQGTIPIHLVEEQVRRPLVDFYHRFLTEHERIPDPLQQFALMIRHGGVPRCLMCLTMAHSGVSILMSRRSSSPIIWGFSRRLNT